MSITIPTVQDTVREMDRDYGPASCAFARAEAIAQERELAGIVDDFTDRLETVRIEMDPLPKNTPVFKALKIQADHFEDIISDTRHFLEQVRETL